jgi:hypothetical protein
LGNAQTFTATISGTTDTSVSWSVNGIAGGSPIAGTISAAGVYTAPLDLPLAPAVQIIATSNSDKTKFATATLTITSDIGVALTPGAAAVTLGASQPFHAAISSSGHPDTAIRWSISGSACPAACGSLDANGDYIAPQILPALATVIVTAQSVADPAKQASAAVTITSSFSLQLSAPSSLASGASGVIAATLTPVPGSNPSTTLSWALSGTGCSGTSCGVLTVVTTQALGGGAMSSSATYTAPPTPPNPNAVTITVTPQADPAKKAQANITIQPGVGVTLSPGTATLAGNHRVTLTAQVFGSTNNAVSWTVNGMANGTGTVGQICAVASNPCQPLTTGNNLQVDYQAPGAIPSPNPVTVRATSLVDTTRSASAQFTVINHVVVTVLPSTATLPPLEVQGFSATVLGASNQSVVWQIQGSACSVARACGAIDANGVYTAPGSAPSPDAVTIVAFSSDDPQQSGLANLAIATGANILALHPASVYAGAANGFTLRVDGSNFATTAAGPGSTLLIAGTARTTTCNSVTECTAGLGIIHLTLQISAAAIPGARTLFIQNTNLDKTAATGALEVQ